MAQLHDMDMSSIDTSGKNVDVYKYFVKAIAVNVMDGATIQIQDEWIRSLTITHEYDPLNMPLIYMQVDANKGLLDTLLYGLDRYAINLTVYKQKKGKGTVKSKYIEGQFKPFLFRQPNYNTNIDYRGFENSERADILEKSTIGLIKIDTINQNKKYINTVIHNTTMTNVITYFTKQFPEMIMEPLEYDDVLSNIVIPPVDTVTKLIKHLDSIRVLYKTPYRFFADFDTTYLLSSSGIKVPKEGETINTILIVARDPKDYNSRIEGMITSDKRKLHQVDVIANNIEVLSDNLTETSFTQINATTTEAEFQEIKPTINRSKYIDEKKTYERIPNANKNMIYNLKAKSESSMFSIAVTKADLDGSVFNPNMEYMVRNFGPHSNMDGRYLLTGKYEVLFREDVEYISHVTLKLKFLAPVESKDKGEE